MVMRGMGIRLIALCLLVVGLENVYAHKNHRQIRSESSEKQIKERDLLQMNLKSISGNYQKSARSIFESKCFNCHGGPTIYPWYYKIPGAQQLINSDIKDAKEHIDMAHGFPFEGHGNPKDDLGAIRDVVTDNSMPPFRYWIFHLNSRLTEDEKKKVLDWTNESLQTFDKKKK